MSHNNNNDSVQETASTPCKNGCGFFGSPATNNMCSLCFKTIFADKQMAVEKAAAPAAAPAPMIQPLPTIHERVEPAISEVLKVEPAAPVAAEVAAPVEDTKPAKKKTNRCHTCNKKVGLTGITCRCGGLYCGSHRYAEAHSCQFDYKAEERKELAKRNPGGGVFDKMEKL